MTWELLPHERGGNKRGPRTTFAISVKKTGAAIWFPHDHPFVKRAAESAVVGVYTFFGKGDHAGKIRLELRDDGRRIQVSKGKIAISPHLKYSTLPFAPKELARVDVEAIADGEAIIITLPWPMRAVNPAPLMPTSRSSFTRVELAAAPVRERFIEPERRPLSPEHPAAFNLAKGRGR